MLRVLALGVIMACGTAGAALAAPERGSMIDKALYCTELYLEAARVISAEGDPIAARAIRAFSRQWLDKAYDLAGPLSRSEISTIRAGYAIDARRDVASKHYRYQRCGTYTNTR